MHHLSKRQVLAFALFTTIIVICTQQCAQRSQTVALSRMDLRNQRKNFMQKLEALNDEDFRYVMRMPRAIFTKLAAELAPFLIGRGIQSKQCSQGNVTPEMCLAVALHYWGAGAYGAVPACVHSEKHTKT